MAFAEYFLRTIFSIIEIYLIFNCVYLLFYALAGHIKKRITFADIKVKRKFCILIPAYKEDVVIIEVGVSALRHKYDGDADVYVIADQLQPETIITLQGYGIKVLEVKFEKSTKGKALLNAIGRITDDTYDIGLILDADNVMADGCLDKINKAFEHGAIALQAHRVAKNYDTTFALLDACNEEINNHLFRKAHYNIGLGSALIGSGMAFTYTYLKHLLIDIDKVVAEDKEMDIRIARDGIKTVYLEDACIYDEKISSAQVFTNQRSRWIFSQIECLRTNFASGVGELFKRGNVDLFDKILQLMLLPRTLLLGSTMLMVLLSLFNPYQYSFVFNLLLFIVAVSSLLLSLPKKFYNARLWNAILTLPAVIVYMVIALLKAGKVKKGWNHTPHTSTMNNIE